MEEARAWQAPDVSEIFRRVNCCFLGPVTELRLFFYGHCSSLQGGITDVTSF
jgi:hypothetical protein